MRNADVEMVDLALSQAIERYTEMNVDEALDAITSEWPAQIAVLLVEVFFKTTCGGCFDIPDFMQLERDDSDLTYFVPVCL